MAAPKVSSKQDVERALKRMPFIRQARERLAYARNLMRQVRVLRANRAITSRDAETLSAQLRRASEPSAAGYPARRR